MSCTHGRKERPMGKNNTFAGPWRCVDCGEVLPSSTLPQPSDECERCKASESRSDREAEMRHRYEKENAELKQQLADRLRALQSSPSAGDVLFWYRDEYDVCDEHYTAFSDGPDKPHGANWKPLYAATSQSAAPVSEVSLIDEGNLGNGETENIETLTLFDECKPEQPAAAAVGVPRKIIEEVIEVMECNDQLQPVLGELRVLLAADPAFPQEG